MRGRFTRRQAPVIAGGGWRAGVRAEGVRGILFPPNIGFPWIIREVEGGWLL